MATQDMILKLSFDDEGTFTGLEDINKALTKTDETTIELEKSTKTLKAQYAELKKQQDQMDPGTEKFKKLSVQMGELKDRMNDAADAVKGNTGPAIEGARASFGMMGEQMMNLDFDGLSQSLNLVSGNLARLKPEDISKGLKSMSEAGINAFKALGKAILANPLLLLAGILVAIAMNFDTLIKLFPSLENALTGIDEQQRSIAKNAQAQADASKKAYENGKLEENSLRLQGKSEKEILQINMKRLETSIKNGKVNLDIQEAQAKSQIDASKRNNSIIQQIVRAGLESGALTLRLLAAPIDAVLATANKVSEALGFGSITALNLNDEITKLTVAGSQMVANLFIDPAAQETELKASFDKQRTEIKQMESDYAGMQLSIKKMDADAAKAKADEAEGARKNAAQLANEAKQKHEAAAAEQLKRDQERAEFEKQTREDKLNEEERLAEEAYQLTLTAQEKEIDAVRNKYFELINLAEEGSAQQLLFIDAQAKAEADIIKKYADAEKAAKEKADKEAIEAEEKLKEEKKKILEEEQALRMANISANFEMASLSLDALMSLNQAAAKGDEASQRKTFERNKLMQKAQATIAMASGIVQQLAVPQDQLTGMNFVKAAAIAAAGIANIVKINQTQFGGGGAGGGNGNLNAPTGTANAPAVDFSGANMQVNAPGSTETYVLAGNVANALEARQKIIDQSHL
jgi:hypothetical protein